MLPFNRDIYSFRVLSPPAGGCFALDRDTSKREKATDGSKCKCELGFRTKSSRNDSIAFR